jgi:hypothetical protein
MSLKLSPDGQYIPFRGWTTISPVRHPQIPCKGKQSESQVVWTNLLAAASKLIRTSQCSGHFACLPEESMHMTLTGLTEECRGRKPSDMTSAPWPEVEAALIQRAMPFFEESYVKKISHHVLVDSDSGKDGEVTGSGVRMKFARVKLTSGIISVEIAPVTPEMEDTLHNWKTDVLRATGLTDKLVEKGSGMQYHITLAYRTFPTGTMKEQETSLLSALKKLFQSSSWTAPELLLNPPAFSCYPDMLQFPTQPLYPINQPLHWLMKQSYGYEMIATKPNFDLPTSNPLSLYSMNLKRNPSASPYSFQGLHEHIDSQAVQTATKPILSSDHHHSLATPSKPSCGIAILGRALENGKVTETLENRLCRGFQAYMESKASNLFERVFIILCGGFTATGLDISEALAMKKWLLSKFAGIPLGDLILEENSLTTVENAIFVRNIIIENPLMTNLTQLKVVTTESHLNRATFLFSNLLCLPHISIESISCLDADPSDAEVEARKSRADYPLLLKRSLTFHCSAFFRSSVLELVKRNRYDELKHFIRSKCEGRVPSPLNSTVDLLGNSALHYSVIHCRPKCLSLLLQSGADVFACNNASKSPLDLAVSKPSLSILSILFAHISRQSDPSLSGAPTIPFIKEIPMSFMNNSTAAAVYLLLAPFQISPDKPQAFIFSLSSSFGNESKLLASYVTQHHLTLPYGNLQAVVQQTSAATIAFSQQFLQPISPTCFVHPSTELVEFSTHEQLAQLIKPKSKQPLLVVLDAHLLTSSLPIPFNTMGYDVYHIHL